MHTQEHIVGRPIDEAVRILADRDESRHPEAVREALDPVTEDGVVTEAAIREAVSDTSMVVATAENRTEFARIAYDEAKETASEVADIPTVAHRLDRFREELESVESRAEALTTDLEAPVEGSTDPTAIYETVLELREVASAAQGVALTADNLKFDIEQFESWVSSPERRYDEFAEDLDLLEDSLDDLVREVATLPEVHDPAAVWADATMRTRMTALLLDDLRAELGDLRTWADRTAAPFREELVADVDALEARCDELSDRLEALADSEWRTRFGDDVTALATDLEAFAPPIDWTAVEETFEQHRQRTFEVE